MSTARGVAASVALAASAALLAACSSAVPSTSDPSGASSGESVRASCGTTSCTGSLHGARYDIELPVHWNGTLLLYNHGYRAVAPVPPDFRPVDTAPEPAPGWSRGNRSTGRALLDQGYALAGSSYASNGWAVAEGVRADEDLYAYFRDSVGAPGNVLVWGDSLGGLITELVAEKHPEWVSGAAPMCAPLAGLVPNMDLALDVAFAVRTLVDPTFALVGFRSYQDSVIALTTATARLLALARSGAKGEATIRYIGALVDAPTRTQQFDGATPSSRVEAAAQGIVLALGYGTYARYDVEQRYGGNPSSNVGTDYASRISRTEAAEVDALFPGTVDRLDAALASASRVAADPGVRSRATSLGGDPLGTLTRPTLTLHTTADPLVLVQNETYFKERYVTALAQGRAAPDLVQLYTSAPATYAPKAGAIYGAGHCNFPPSTRVGLISLLARWVQEGTYPGTAAATEAIGATRGFAPNFAPAPWPAGTSA